MRVVQHVLACRPVLLPRRFRVLVGRRVVAPLAGVATQLLKLHGVTCRTDALAGRLDLPPEVVELVHVPDAPAVGRDEGLERVLDRPLEILTPIGRVFGPVRVHPLAPCLVEQLGCVVRLELRGLDQRDPVPNVDGAGRRRRDPLAQVERAAFLQRGTLHVRRAHPVALGGCPGHHHDVELVSVRRTPPPLVARRQGVVAVVVLDDQQVEVALPGHLTTRTGAEQDDLIRRESLDDESHGGVEAFRAKRWSRGCHRFRILPSGQSWSRVTAAVTG